MNSLINSTIIIEAEFTNPANADVVLLEAGALDGLSIFYVLSAGDATFYTDLEDAIAYYKQELWNCSEWCLT